MSDDIRVIVSPTPSNTVRVIPNQLNVQIGVGGQQYIPHAHDQYYLNSNPSGFITSGALSGYAETGWVNSNYYPISNPSGFATGIDSSYLATKTELYNTGQELYPRSNPSGFITGFDLSAYATSSDLYSTGQFLYPRTNPSGFITGLDTGNFVSKGETGILLGRQETGVFETSANASSLYYLKSNPSGFITGVDNSSLATKTELYDSGQALYPRSNPSGFITGVNLSSYATNTSLYETGQALYPKDNPSGFITGVDLSAYYPRSNPSGFITGVDLTSYATNLALYNTGQSLYPRNNPSGFLTGVDLSSYATKTQLFDTGQALYPRNNPSGFITGVDLSNYVQKSETGNLVDNEKLLDASGALVDLISAASAGVVTLNGLSGIVSIVGTGGTQVSIQDQNIIISGGSSLDTGNFYTRDNPSGFITGVNLSSYATKSELYNTGQELYPRSNPSGFITGVDTSALATKTQLYDTGQALYPRSNPSGFITGVDLSNYATDAELYNTGQSLYPNSNPSGFITGNLSLGDPTDGSYGGSNGPIAGVQNGDKIEDAFDKVELILGKLAPSKPVNLSAATFALTNTTYTAYEQGTIISRTNVINSNIPIGRATGFYDGDAGTLSSYINGSLSGSRVLTTGKDIGTYGGLQIYEDGDFWSGVAGKAGFWSYLNVYSTPSAGLTSGQFTLRLQHSSTGPTNTITGYCERVLTPTVGIQNVATGITIREITDGVPSLTNTDPITVYFTTTGTVSAFYRAPMAIVSSSQTSSSNINTTGTPFSGQSLNLSGTVTVNNSTFITGWVASVQSFNAIGTASSAATYTTNIYIDTNSAQPASRRLAGLGQYPSIYGGTYNNDTSLATNEELQMINNVIQHPPKINYSTRQPVGPDYRNIQTGSYNNYRWACFNMGTITTDSSITLGFGGTSNFGSNPVISNFALYIRVSGSSPTNGWINGNAAYPGVGNPTNDGDAALVVASSSATSKYITFGSTTRDGTVWVRVGLPSGDNKSFSSITMT